MLQSLAATLQGRRRTLGAAILTLILVASILGWNLQQHGRDPFTEHTLDDCAWIFSSYYFQLAFVRWDLLSEDWQHIDCRDHAPLFKYLVGGALALQGFSVDSIESKQVWLEYSGLNKEELISLINRQIPEAAAYQGRLLSAVLLFAASMAVFAAARLFFSDLAAISAAVFFALAPTTRDLGSRIMADSLLVLLVVLTFIAQWFWIRSLLQQRRAITPAALVVGLLCALTVSTKISGIVALPLAISISWASILLWQRRRHRCVAPAMPRVFAAEDSVDRSHALASPNPTSTDPANANPGELPRGFYWRVVGLSSTFVALICGLLTILVNPSLYPNPVSFFLLMYAHRLSVVSAQSVLFPRASMPTLGTKIAAFLDAIFVAGDAVFPLMLFCFCVGAMKLPWLYSRKPCEVFVFTGTALGWFTALWLTFSLNQARYLYPLLPFVVILTGLGVDECFMRLRNLGTSVSTRLELLGLPCIVCGVVWIAVQYWNIDTYILRNPQWYLDAQAKARAAAEGFERMRDEAE